MIKNKQKKGFFQLSEGEQKKIMEKAARAANKEQRELVERVERREKELGKSEQSQTVCDSPR